VRSLGRKPTPTQVNRERTEIEVPRDRWTARRRSGTVGRRLPQTPSINRLTSLP